jgi:hypothetical protein
MDKEDAEEGSIREIEVHVYAAPAAMCSNSAHILSGSSKD